MKIFILSVLLGTIISFQGFSALASEKIIFLSTQLAPIKEAQVMREKVLEQFPSPVEFMPADKRNFFFGLISQKQVMPSLVGALHGEYVQLAKTGYFLPLDDLVGKGKKKELNQRYIALGNLNGQQVFLPWMQATYLMVANKKSLAYLPKGADLNRLTYDQLLQWAETLKSKTGSPKLGFPAGQDGLMHRFFQGYLYPSFTGTMVREFRSNKAEEMWNWFSRLWRSVSPHSLTYRAMAEPLLTDEVWVAWDHSARLMEAVSTKPDDFVAFPAPAGPKGRGFMLVLAGLGIPKESNTKESGKKLMEFLLTPKIQTTIMINTGFFPVISGASDSQVPKGLGEIHKAVAQQSTSSDALPALLPVGIGERGNDFNNLYLTAFSRIVVRNQPPGKVLPALANRMNKLLQDVKAPCWPPDSKSEGPCPVK